MSHQQSAAASGLTAFGVALNVVMYLSPLQVYRNIVHVGDASRFSVMPAVGLFLTSGTWVCYAALVLPTPQMLAINAFGTVLSLVYIGIIYHYTKPAEVVFTGVTRRAAIAGIVIGYFAVLAGLYGGFFGAARNPIDITTATRAVSIFTIIVNSALWLGPLMALRKAFLELDTFTVSRPLSALQLCVGITWTIAGVLLDDITVIVTSAVGIVLSALQIGVLVAIAVAVARGGKPAVLVIKTPQETATASASSPEGFTSSLSPGP
jgi:hypothetical protein